MRYEGKWPIASDRDFVNVAFSERVSENLIIVATATVGDLYEYPEVKKVVRGEVIVGGYIL